MSSYYGGKPGKSFIIVETFDSIASMTAKFALGPAYTDVAFDEYVIINTQHKHNPENGQIFRRGYDYNSDRKIMNYQLVQDDKKQNQKYEAVAISAFGAIYVGTIAGPAGRAPQLNLTTYENIAFNEITEDGQPKIVSLADLKLALYPDDQTILMKLNQEFPQGKDLYEEDSLRPFYAVKIDINENRGDNHIVEYHYYCCDNTILNDKTVYSAGWYQVASAPSYGIGSYTLDNKNLVPTVTYDGFTVVEEGKNKGQKHLKPDVEKYQDTIDWKYMTVVNENHEDATAFIGFRFPVPITEFEVEAVDPYYHRNDNLDNEDNKTTSFQNINLLDSISTNDEKGVHPFYSKWKINIPKGIKGDCINNFRITPASEKIQVPITIEGQLQYNINGSLKVRQYGYDNDGNKITDENNPERDDIEHSREVIVYDYTTYNRVAEGDTYTFYLGDYNIINDLTLDADGTLTFKYTHEDDTVFEKKSRINWINDVQFNEDGTIIIKMNNNNLDTDESDFEDTTMQKDHLVKWINQMNIADDGTITVVPNNEVFEFNNKTSDENGKIIEEHLIKWIDEFDIDEHGTITIKPNNEVFKFNNKTSDAQGVIIEPQLIKWITDVALNPDNGYFKVTFNQLDEQGNKQFYEQNLNWIKDIQLTEDGRLVYDYTHEGDNTTEPKIKWIKDVNLDSEGHLVITFNQYKLDEEGVNTDILQTYETDLSWLQDLTVKEDGTLVYDYTVNETNTVPKVIKWIEEINFDNDGTIYLKMNNDSAILNDEARQELKLSKFITWLTQLELDEDTGLLEVGFNNETQTNAKSFSKELTWVKDIKLSKDGVVTLDKTTGSNDLQQKITWIENVTFDKDNGMLNITFNNGNISNIQTQLDYVTGVSAEGNYLYTTSIGGTKKEAGLVPCTIASEVKPNNFNTYANGSVWFKLEEK